MRLFYTLAFASLLSACGGGSDSSSSTSDTIAPVITLAGDAQITVQYDDSYVDAGARALDNVDGDISVIVDGEVDTSLVGSYKLTFTATDSSGNSSSATRMVNVVDTIPPVISLTGDTEVTVEFGEVYVDAGATAIDNADGDVSVIVDGEVNTSTIGSYQLTYTATDSSGNSSSATRMVNVVDTIPPVISLTGDTEVTVELGEVYVDAGARALDNVDGDISVIVDGEVNTSTIGSYQLTYTATDSSGNSSSATRMVNVVDTIPPVISLTGDTEVTVELGEVYVDAGATAIDNADGDISVIVDGEVNTSTIGSYQLTYTATDSSGNSSSVTRAVTIIEKLTTIAGKVIDGYVSGATVWLDYNGNGKFDEQTEPSTMSGEAGDYSFEFTEEQKQCLPYSTMYVDVPVGALDEDTGIVTEAYQMALPPSINILSDDELRHISPLTSSIWGLLRSQLKDSGKGNLSCADLMDDIALRNEIRAVVGSVILNAVSHYNLSEEQMFADFILDDNSDAYDAAQEVVKGLKAAYKYTLNLNEQYPSAVEIRVVVYQSTENDERYNLDTAWYRDVVIFLDNKTISEDVKLKDTGALDQVDYVLTRLERVDSPWGDQKYNGVLSIRNDVYVNEDLTYRCGVIEKIILEKNDITYEIDNSMPTQDSPTFESCSANAIETPFERSFRVSYLVDDINYFGVFFFRDDKSEFNSLSAWLNIIDKADDLDPTDVFTYMNALPYEFDSAVQVDASYWRKRKTAGNVQIDTNNDNEWVRTTQREDYTTYTECSVDGINWDSCS